MAQVQIYQIPRISPELKDQIEKRRDFGKLYHIIDVPENTALYVKMSLGLYVTGMPNTNRVEYLAINKEGKYFLIHKPEESDDKKDLRLHIGPLEGLVETKIKYAKIIKGMKSLTLEYSIEKTKGILVLPTDRDSPIKPKHVSYNTIEEPKILVAPYFPLPEFPGLHFSA